MSARRFDAVVVGAGFAGLYMVYRLRQRGFSVLGLERAADVGGTWYWNRYPGARCDVASMEYSYSFCEELQQEWEWTERYASQPEILRYLCHVADRFGLRPLFRFNTSVDEAVYDDEQASWTLHADDGFTVAARYCVMATGALSAARIPDLPGLGNFAGAVLHTGQWPHQEVDFAGKSVAVIGTGSSGVQVIPAIADHVARLTVFQRTPNFSLRAGNHPLSREAVAQIKARYAEFRQEARYSRNGGHYEYATQPLGAVSAECSRAEFERRWNMGGANFLHAYTDIVVSEEANAVTADFVRSKISATVRDPRTVRKLLPFTYPIGSKRICLDTNYFETFNRDHVHLVDLGEEPLQEILPGGIKTDAREYPADLLILATGFDAVTGALLSMNIRSTAGKSLRAAWQHGAVSYLGIMVAGFPNLFIVTGPGSPSVISNMVTSIEQHVEWIADCLQHLRDRHLCSIEPAADFQDAWVKHVRELADATLFPRAKSWFMGANIPGKPRVFLPYIGGVGNYRRKCEQVVADGYHGFVLRASANSPT